MALYFTWDALPLQGELPSQAWGSKPQIPLPFPHPITAQLLILAAEAPLSSTTLSQCICQGNEVPPFVLVTSDKLRHLG